jgi:cytochrome P450
MCFFFHRGMVSDSFTRDHIEALRPKLIKTIEQSIDNLIAAGKKQLPVDLVAEFALLVPTLVRDP